MYFKASFKCAREFYVLIRSKFTFFFWTINLSAPIYTRTILEPF